MPPVQQDISKHASSATRFSLVQQELNYDIVLLQRESAKLIKSLNHEQRHVYDTIMSSLSSTSSKCFYFVHDFGGTGKTFLWNA